MITSSIAAVCFLVLFTSEPCFGATGYDPNQVRLKSCEPNTNCVSSGFNEPPNRYLSPLRIVNDREEAFRRAIRDITAEASKNSASIQIVEVLPRDFYIHLTVPGTAPASFDDVELLFRDDGIVNLRGEARVTLPPPPFCIKKNCINGNMDQRERIEKIARLLGLPPADQAQMQKGAKWTPIFFNSDRVPGFYDDYDDYD
eukprot:CAMPEP_0202464268 /NCGR_PEP_ID=MMETSP1360-20130828/61411_1 /ASSEMBLY_ACC=CAM_ASM_000848 /TAXON_ID=515479 /ORGANISM="Licmophora paradoxa, Strain CCMP2313" /LENGTH=199 /DNA_ID=CAMNT_0049087517 /DNA_START=32 /DNA_END=631 /DNA_ORIENTATION=-